MDIGLTDAHCHSRTYISLQFSLGSALARPAGQALIEGTTTARPALPVEANVGLQQLVGGNLLR